MDNPRDDSYGDDASKAENPGRARFQAEGHPLHGTGYRSKRNDCIDFGTAPSELHYRPAGGQLRSRKLPEDTNMICDFCNAPNPLWRFRARPFLIDYGPITG